MSPAEPHDRRRGWCLVMFLLGAAVTLPAGAQNQPVSQQPSNPNNVLSLAYSPDGQFLAASAGETTTPGIVVVWEIPKFTVRWVRRESVGIPSIAFSPSGKRLAAGSFGKDIVLLDVATGQIERTISGHTNYVRAVVFGDENVLFSASYDMTVRRWDAASGQPTATQTTNSDKLRAIVVSSRKALLLAGGNEPQIRVWNLADLSPQSPVTVNSSIVPTIDISTDGRWLVSGHWDGYVRVRDLDGGEERTKFRSNVSAVRCVRISPDNRWVAICGDSPDVHLVQLLLDEPAKELRDQIAALVAQLDEDSYDRRESADQQLRRIGMAADSQLLEATDSESPEVRIRARRLRQHLQDHPQVVTLTGHDQHVSSLCFAPEGRMLASGDKVGRIKIWDIAAAKELRAISLADQNQAQR